MQATGHRPTAGAVKRPSLLLTAFAAALALAGSASAGNPFGIRLVGFAPATTPAQMCAAVTSAGGVVVTDLGAVNALAVVSRSPGFASLAGADRRVGASFEDSASAASRGRPIAARFPTRGTSSTRSSASRTPGDLQWDDNRTNVPAAWTTTAGDSSVAVACSKVRTLPAPLPRNEHRAPATSAIPPNPPQFRAPSLDSGCREAYKAPCITWRGGSGIAWPRRGRSEDSHSWRHSGCAAAASRLSAGNAHNQGESR
jgi:hypothetical protein